MQRCHCIPILSASRGQGRPSTSQWVKLHSGLVRNPDSGYRLDFGQIDELVRNSRKLRKRARSRLLHLGRELLTFGQRDRGVHCQHGGRFMFDIAIWPVLDIISCMERSIKMRFERSGNGEWIATYTSRTNVKSTIHVYVIEIECNCL